MYLALRCFRLLIGQLLVLWISLPATIFGELSSTQKVDLMKARPCVYECSKYTQWWWLVLFCLQVLSS